jgi:hypothetical protein
LPDDGMTRASRRAASFDALARSGWFTQTELATIRALAFQGLTLTQYARLERCSRQAVCARLYGNSRGHGGLLRKALRFWAQAGLDRARPTSDRS